MLTPPFYQTPSLSARRFDWGLCCDVLYSVERPGDACGGDGPDEDLGGRDAAVEFDLAVPFVPAEGPHHATAAANAWNRSPGKGWRSRHVIPMGCSDACATYVAGPRKKNARSSWRRRANSITCEPRSACC